MSETQTDPRHIARAIALQQLFNRLITQTEPFTGEDLLAELEGTDFDQQLATDLVEGVDRDIAQIDPLITQYAPAWPISQIAPVDLVILRMGIWEAFISNLNPAKIVINECVNLAKEFGGESSGSFVNGVLGNILHDRETALQSTETTNE